MRPGLMSQVHFLSDAKSHHASFFMYKNEIKLPAYSVKKKKKKKNWDVSWCENLVHSDIINYPVQSQS